MNAEPFVVDVPDPTVDDLRERLARLRSARAAGRALRRDGGARALVSDLRAFFAHLR